MVVRKRASIEASVIEEAVCEVCLKAALFQPLLRRLRRSPHHWKSTRRTHTHPYQQLLVGDISLKRSVPFVWKKKKIEVCLLPCSLEMRVPRVLYFWRSIHYSLESEMWSTDLNFPATSTYCPVSTIDCVYLCHESMLVGLFVLIVFVVRPMSNYLRLCKV